MAERSRQRTRMRPEFQRDRRVMFKDTLFGQLANQPANRGKTPPLAAYLKAALGERFEPDGKRRTLEACGGN